mgnify:CR=1 FL=1
MSFTSLSYIDEQLSQFKNLEIGSQKTYNHYEPDKPNNKFSKTEIVSSSNFWNSSIRDIENNHDSKIYQEVDDELNYEENNPSTPTSLYDYMNFEENTPSDQTSSYYHYPVFKLKCLHLDDNSSISEKSYLSLYDGTYLFSFLNNI